MVDDYRGIPIACLGNACLLFLRELAEGELCTALEAEVARRFPPDAPPRLVDVPPEFRERYEAVVVDTIEQLRLRKGPGRIEARPPKEGAIA